MDLSRYCLSVYLPEAIGLTPTYCADLVRTCQRFSDWAGDPVPLAEVDACLPVFLRHLAASGLSPVSVNNRRRQLLTLLVSAYDNGYLDRPPRRPRRLREPSEPPQAWTVEQVGELLWTAQHWPGSYCGVPAGVWWDSLFTATYWSAERIGALRLCRVTDYDGTSLLVRGSTTKTGRGRRYALPDHARAKLDAMLGGNARDGELWPWPFCRRWFFTVARKIIERAGLPAPKTGRQLFHRLRRTNLSYCAAESLALAQSQAGHSSPQLTQRHYVDERIAKPRSAADVLPRPHY